MFKAFVRFMERLSQQRRLSSIEGDGEQVLLDVSGAVETGVDKPRANCDDG